SEDLAGIGITGSAEAQVSRLATLTKNCGLDGVVCSAQEAPRLKAEQGVDFKLITPGIRPLTADKGDQQRIMTPTDALKAGSDYLVIGRPIPQAPDPLAALEAIYAEVFSAGRCSGSRTFALVCLFWWGVRVGRPFQKTLRAHPCALRSGHPWPPRFLERPPHPAIQATPV